MLNRKVKYMCESLHEVIFRLYRLHYILRLHFAAPKSWAILHYHLGFPKKRTSCQSTIRKLNSGRFKWVLKRNVPTTGWVSVTFLTAECGLFASNDIFEKIFWHTEKYSIQIKCTLTSATVDLLFKKCRCGLGTFELARKRPLPQKATDFQENRQLAYHVQP